MFDTLAEVLTFYQKKDANRHEIIFKEFDKNIQNYFSDISNAFKIADGFGELAFCWHWYLLVSSMSDNFKFIEIGVYKGRILGIIHLLAKQLNKQCEIYGLTPLTNTGDKYSVYNDENYSYTLLQNLSKMNVNFDNINIIKGYSTDADKIAEANQTGPYDIVFIDGCHDYDVVCQDIVNYLPMLKIGGYLVMDDASLFIDNPYGGFLGHEDVCKAIRDNIDNNSNLIHLFAIGHNRIWQKIN